ncbi:MAG: sensor histidine kinase [Hylemonella sp.]
MSAPHAPPPALPSLRAHLVRHLLLPLALTWLLGSAIMVAVFHHFAQKAFDRALLDDAYALASRVRLQSHGLALELNSREMGALLFDQSENIYFVVRRLDGAVIAGHPGLHAIAPLRPGQAEFSDAVYQGHKVRAVTLWQEHPFAFQVVVAQTTGSRQALLHDALLYSLLPEVLLLLALAWWLRRVVGAELQPLNELERRVNERDASDLTPLPLAARTRDVQALGAAINALLQRVQHSLRAQREFSGNVAHELRTPLAGIRALAEYGLAQDEPAAWRGQLQRILASEARASRLVEQLLALALADEAATAVELSAVALDEVVRETVLRYLPQADAAGVDLGVQGLDRPVRVLGNVALIEGILGNLIDNALRYGRPTAGRAPSVTVAVAAEGETVRLCVQDNGPGLSADQRQCLLQRGARGVPVQRVGEGAGLGLAIVTKFAALLQARFELDAGSDGTGLCARLTLRRAA